MVQYWPGMRVASEVINSRAAVPGHTRDIMERMKRTKVMFSFGSMYGGRELSLKLRELLLNKKFARVEDVIATDGDERTVTVPLPQAYIDCTCVNIPGVKGFREPWHTGLAFTTS